MKLQFYKYEGCGNDFIMIDGRASGNLPLLNPEKIAALCNRRFGIGADGLVILKPSDASDFEMLYYNSDGKESSMCGNGGRCIVAFAKHLNIISEQTTFKAIDGMHDAVIFQDQKTAGNAVSTVKLKMKDVDAIEAIGKDQYLDTGSPHYIVLTDAVETMDVVQEGKKIRYNDRFKQSGTNVNFVENYKGGIYVRTYERGVEDETLSCGTGVTASALAADNSGLLNSNGIIDVHTRGGELKVYFRKNNTSYSDVWLEGPARFVFKGETELV